MAQVLKPAQAGTLESNDIMITIAPNGASEGIILELDSIVMAQYGDAISRTILQTVAEQGVAHTYIKAIDRGALDCTIRARTLAVLSRSGVLLEEVLL